MDGCVYLYKKSSSGFANAGLECYSEYYSSQYSSVICKEYVDYELVRAMREDLEIDSPYIQELKDVSLRLYEKYNLPKERADFLDKQVRHQIEGILS